MDFEYYLDVGDIEKVSNDPGMSRALIEDAESRLAYVKSVIDHVTIKDENAKYIFETNYDILRTCAECLMKADGYNTKAPNTHEISVAFIKDKYRDFGESLVDDFNRYRRMRNESKYRAYYVSKDIAKDSFNVAEEYVRITRLIVDSKLR
jgi:hypothetical protein